MTEFPPSAFTTPETLDEFVKRTRDDIMSVLDSVGSNFNPYQKVAITNAIMVAVSRIMERK